MRFKRKHPLNATLAGIEELDLFPDEQAREAAIKSHADSIKGWSLVSGIAICSAIALSAFVFARFVLVPGISQLMPRGLPPWAREPLQFAFVISVIFLTVRGMHRWGVRRALRQKLITHKVPICISCGYLLRGLPATADCCPECGKDIEDAVRTILAEKSDEVTQS